KIATIIKERKDLQALQIQIRRWCHFRRKPCCLLLLYRRRTALKFLNKKGWHTGSLWNIENVWKAEQKRDAEDKKLDELRKQIVEKHEHSEFHLLHGYQTPIGSQVFQYSAPSSRHSCDALQLPSKSSPPFSLQIRERATRLRATPHPSYASKPPSLSEFKKFDVTDDLNNVAPSTPSLIFVSANTDDLLVIAAATVGSATSWLPPAPSLFSLRNTVLVIGDIEGKLHVPFGLLQRRDEGKRQVMIHSSSKVIIKFILVMQRHGYMGEFEYVDNHRVGKIMVELKERLNMCGVISPRFDKEHNDLKSGAAQEEHNDEQSCAQILKKQKEKTKKKQKKKLHVSMSTGEKKKLAFIPQTAQPLPQKKKQKQSIKQKKIKRSRHN
ncbi:hypothetical protein DVH24_035797, partial [Malus domestica]